MSRYEEQGVLPFESGGARLDHPYLTKQLIAYIGNKRALQPLLYRVFNRLVEDGGSGGLPGGSRAPLFLDPFAGSGSVARLARYLGYRVLANDWELYAYILNYAHLCAGESEARELFRARGGPEAILAELNAPGDPAEGDRYISRYYAPARTQAADYRRERLFYTRENALVIDAVRSRIEALYPGTVEEASGGGLPGSRYRADAAGEAALKEKMLLLAALLYQCATHTNTSGVFKACHKGFGGHGRDALGRILKPIHLQMPVLIDSPEPSEVGCEDALRFVRSRPADICYLDPPYNQHQYGSNYHLLNTIARWDRPEVDNGLRADGRLKHKAGIRRDWIRTRSEFCYRRSAAEAFHRLLEQVDARHVVLSYNTEGIIPFDELVELMSRQGRVELHGNEYVKYRGGKQSLSRQVHNLEFVLVLDRSRRTSRADRSRLERAVAVSRLGVTMKRSFCPDKVRHRFSLEADDRDCLPVRPNGRILLLPMPHLYRFAPEAAPLLEAAYMHSSAGELQRLLDKLEACEPADRREEIQVLVEILAGGRRQGGGGDCGEGESIQRRILWLLRKFAHRKYRNDFELTLSELRALTRQEPERFSLLILGLEEIEALARARFAG